MLKALKEIKFAGKIMTENISPSAGVPLNYIPYILRLGLPYKHYSRLAESIYNAGDDMRKEYVIEKFNNVYQHFRSNSAFYNNHLRRNVKWPEKIRTLEDISLVPPINKAILRATPIQNRTIVSEGLRSFNTGGTSGSPLAFYLENTFYSREWAHIHFMWKKLGYNPSKTKITIRGKSVDGLYKYRYHQNEFMINSYHSFTDRDFKELYRVFKKYNTEFIHGYPSSIYYFLKEIVMRAPYLLDFLRQNIKGIMLSSEFPSPQYRNLIEDLITPNTMSWYGHTEGVVMAAEMNEKYKYIPFLSYGYTEAILKDGKYHLAGTSLYNFATPFVRYDTEDIIKPTFDTNGMLEYFEITEGRLAEFVFDRKNKKIALTGLLFGRHHKLFDKVNFIQVKQSKPGEMTVFYSTHTDVDNPADLFDSTNLDMAVNYEQVKEPFRTAFGKIPLLIQ
jgi:phenylacetate-CoA ligase